MSATGTLLIFLDSGNEYEGWLLLADGVVAGRGSALDGLPLLIDEETKDPLRLVAIVPGEAVSIHWLEVPAGLAPAQAVAAARMMASDVSAQPLGDMHIAVGDEVEESALRTVALVPALAMIGWLARLQANGIDPDIVLPEPLLLLVPDEGLARYDRGGNPLFRGASDAFTIEPELAETVIGGAPVVAIDQAGFEAGLAEAITRAPVNLRQPPFAKRRQWTIEWPLVWRLAMLALAILVVTLLIQFAAILRYTYAADALESEAQQVAGKVLPGSAATGDSAARLTQRLAELRGGGIGYEAITASVFSAIQATPNVEMTAIAFDRDGSLRITIQADTPTSIAALQQRFEASGLAITAGAPVSGGGRPQQELTVRAR